MSRDYQWFVAWRYLMARPRKVSAIVAAIAGVAAFALVACLVVAYGLLDDPAPIRGFVVHNLLREQLKLGAVGAGALLELVVLFGLIRYAFTFFTSVSVGGVTIGSMALVITLSIMSGFETDLRDKILGTNAHLLIEKREGEFTEYREVSAQLAGIEGVVAATPYLTSEVVIGAGSNYSNVVIKGVEPETVAAVTDLERNLQEDGSIERLWPVEEDAGAAEGDADAGSPPAPPAAAADVLADPVPDDFVAPSEPTDFSAGVDELPPEPARAEPAPAEPAPAELHPEPSRAALDPLPDDFELPEGTPEDFSGAAETPDEWPERGSGEDGFARATEGLPLPGSVRPRGRLDAIAELDDALGVGGDEPDPFRALRDDQLRGTGYAGARRNIGATPRVNRLPGVLVGRELVKTLHLYVGQEVSLVAPLGQMTPAGPAPRTKPYRVAGTFYTGMYEYDTKSIYVELGSLQRFLSLGDEVDEIEVRVDDPERADRIKRVVAARLGDRYEVKDWQEINRSLFAALKLEKIAMFLVLAIIILVASFSIIGNLIMVVVEKAREIALLKTIGSSDRGIMKIFVVQGFFIGLVGTGLGVANGLLACWLGKVYGLPLDPNVYYIDRLPIHVEWVAVAAVAVAGIAISVVATLYPAYLGARVQPVEGLRHD